MEAIMRDIPTLILRAFSLVKESSNMAFLGIYSAETYEPLAFADREHVQINATLVAEENNQKKMAVEIKPEQIKAIVKHIRTADNPITQIRIGKLLYLCLSQRSGCMTGVSSFNVDTTRTSIAEINERVFNIIHKKYTSQDLLAEDYSLQISAIIKEDLIIVGICREGEESCLEVLKSVFEKPKSQEEIMGVKEPLIKPEVELRCSVRPLEGSASEIENANACKDYFVGTPKTYDPFRLEDDVTGRDDRPLIEDIESIDIRIDVQ